MPPAKLADDSLIAPSPSASTLQRNTRTTLARAADYWPVAIVLLGVILGTWFRAQGLNRSLWLDEAWVANSVLESTIPRMLIYSAWVPSPEPGFLVVARIVATGLGPSNITFRVVPFAFSLLGLGAMLLLLLRFFSPIWAAFGFALFAFSPQAIFYAHGFKQYSTELAMAPILLLAAVYCNSYVSTRRLTLLLLAIVIAVVFAYPSVFLLPAVCVLLIQPRSGESFQRRGVNRAVIAALCGFAAFGFLYLTVIRYNITPTLRLFWAYPFVGITDRLRHAASASLAPYSLLLPIPQRLLSPLVLGTLGLAAMGVMLYHPRSRPRLWLVSAAILPQVAVWAAFVLGLYPANERTMLFLLPCWIILVTSLFESVFLVALELASRTASRRLIQSIVPVATLLVLAIGCSRQLKPDPILSDDNEDTQSAVAWLKTAFHEGDNLYVHASVQQQFKLYSRLLGFAPGAVQWGNTGWPCCPRNIGYWRGRGSVNQLDQDISRLYPGRLPLRLWTLYTLRYGNWTYVGLDEGEALRRLLLDRGCTQVLSRKWDNVAANRFNCTSSLPIEGDTENAPSRIAGSR